MRRAILEHLRIAAIGQQWLLFAVTRRCQQLSSNACDWLGRPHFSESLAKISLASVSTDMNFCIAAAKQHSTNIMAPTDDSRKPAKKQKSRFAIGPANLPDGTHRRKSVCPKMLRVALLIYMHVLTV
jgi:hypothetical protein